jgi:hypothetical protein
MSRGRIHGLAAALVTILWVSPGTAQSADPTYGTWKLDVAKSTFSPGPAPKELTVTIEADGPGRKVSVVGTDGDGAPVKWGYTGTFDRKENPVTGNNPNADVVMLRRLSPTTTRATYKKAGKETNVNGISVSADGKTLTVASSGTNAEGKPVKSTMVFVKQ